MHLLSLLNQVHFNDQSLSRVSVLQGQRPEAESESAAAQRARQISRNKIKMQRRGAEEPRQHLLDRLNIIFEERHLLEATN